MKDIAVVRIDRFGRTPSQLADRGANNGVR